MIGRNLLCGGIAGAINAGFLLTQKSSNKKNSSLNFAVLTHASVFTGLSVTNIMAKSAGPRTMGVVFLPLALFGNHLYLRQSKNN